MSGTDMLDRVLHTQVTQWTQGYHSTVLKIDFILKNTVWGFPGGPVVKNPPCNAGDTSLIPSPERPHMRWST